MHITVQSFLGIDFGTCAYITVQSYTGIDLGACAYMSAVLHRHRRLWYMCLHNSAALHMYRLRYMYLL